MTTARPCPACGQSWIPWAGSTLKTHGRCHFGPERNEEILARFEREPGLLKGKLAAELGVTRPVLESILKAARRARQARS